MPLFLLNHHAVPAALRHQVPRLAALLLAAALSACGGGSGGGDSGRSAPDASSPALDTSTQDTGAVAPGNPAPASPDSAAGPTEPAAPDPGVALQAALASGDASAVNLAEVQSAARAQLQTQAAAHTAARQAFFALTATGSPTAASPSGMDWNPSHDSSTFTVLDSARNQVMLAGNWRYADSTAGSGRVLAVAGQAPATGARYAAFGGNPLAVPGNAAMDTLMRNTVAWLTGRTRFDNLKVVTAHLPGQATYWFPHEAKVRTWFSTQFPGVTLNGVASGQAQGDDRCDGDKLDACLQGADLLVIGRQQGPNVGNSTTPDEFPTAYDGATVMQAVAAAQARGVPVLYLHHYRDANNLAARLLEYFGLSVNTNYFAQEGLKAYSASDLPEAPAGLAAQQALLQRLEQGGFSSTWSGCVNDLGRVKCDADTAFVTEFDAPAKALRTRLRALDTAGTALFSRAGYQQEKLLVLLGDKYRESVSYPLRKESAGLDFYRAYFSDMAAYVNRGHNQVARNLGNFSGLFAADTPTLRRTVAATSPASGRREVMTGLYVMPGRSVTVNRNDSSAAAVTVGLNMLRDTTHVFNTYDRPTMLASPRVPLVAGQPRTLTSPFGGPLFLFIESAAGAPSVSVTVDGVITHPLLRDANDPAQVAAFQAELASTPTNWVGLTTDALTVHSNLGHFRTTLAAVNNDMARLVGLINTYMVKDTYELAGFSSSTAGALQLPASVTAFCNQAGWDCTGSQHLRDVMQHVIADNHANCGAGCSGNPYDQDWALEPLGWGESHEIGHNLQRSRLNIYGGQSGEVSNNIFPMHKQWRYNQTLANPAQFYSRNGTGARAVFDKMVAALASNDPVATMRASVWGNTAYAADNGLRLSFYRQLVEYARHYNNNFADGWELYTLLYLLERNLGVASATWDSAKTGLGFGTYAAYPSGIDGNDFMLVATSRIIGRDLRPVFDLWGIGYSAAASGQVAAFALPAAEKLLFPMSNVNRFGSGVGAPVLMSPSATYPAGY
jgi:immunomodulating metalloprotease